MDKIKSLEEENANIKSNIEESLKKMPFSPRRNSIPPVPKIHKASMEMKKKKKTIDR